MTEHDPHDSPFAPAPAPSPSPRIELWRLQKAGRKAIGEIRNDTAKGGGWHVLLREEGELSISKMCQSFEQAHYVAESWRQDYRRAGYDALITDLPFAE